MLCSRGNTIDPYRGPGLPLHAAAEQRLSSRKCLGLAKAPLLYVPGQRWRYSLAVDGLVAIVGEAAGTDRAEVVRSRVTAPLHLQDLSFAVEDVKYLATPYADGTPEPRRMVDGTALTRVERVLPFYPSRALDRHSYASGGSGMCGTANDVLRFFEAIRAGGAPILRASTVQQLMTDQVGAQEQALGPGWGFGFGWAVLDDPQLAKTPQSQGTIPWGGSYGHRWFVDPVRRVTVVALTNTAFQGFFGAFPTEIRDAIDQ